MAARLGNVIYWFCSAVAALVIVYAVLVGRQYSPSGDVLFGQIAIGLIGVGIWLVGRAVRYVLADR